MLLQISVRARTELSVRARTEECDMLLHIFVWTRMEE